MIEKFEKSFEHFNSSYISLLDGFVQISEKKEEGQGTVTFEIPGKALLIKAKDQAPLIWALKNGKCAEGAFLTYEENQYHLHIVELKRTVRLSNWKNIINQFEGMFLSSIALLRLIDILSVDKITCYIAYNNDKFYTDKSPQPALLKTHVGMKNPLSGLNEWEKCHVELPLAFNASIKKIERDQNTGNAQYTL